MTLKTLHTLIVLYLYFFPSFSFSLFHHFSTFHSFNFHFFLFHYVNLLQFRHLYQSPWLTVLRDFSALPKSCQWSIIIMYQWIYLKHRSLCMVIEWYHDRILVCIQHSNTFVLIFVSPKFRQFASQVAILVFKFLYSASTMHMCLHNLAILIFLSFFIAHFISKEQLIYKTLTCFSF